MRSSSAVFLILTIVLLTYDLITRHYNQAVVLLTEMKRLHILTCLSTCLNIYFLINLLNALFMRLSVLTSQEIKQSWFYHRNIYSKPLKKTSLSDSDRMRCDFTLLLFTVITEIIVGVPNQTIAIVTLTALFVLTCKQKKNKRKDVNFYTTKIFWNKTKHWN